VIGVVASCAALMRTGTQNTILKTHTTAFRSVVLALMLAAGLLCNVHSLSADQAQYYYDELGRLMGVVNGQGDAAVYQYDEVGNLLKIDRFTTAGGNIGIFFFTPGSSLVNKPVEIRGFGYTTPASSNTVSFNGATATVVSGTSSSLLVTVPTAATTGPVTLTNANGTATSPQAFTVLVPPIITGITPPKVAQGVSTQVVIEGFNLQSATTVQLRRVGSTVVQPGFTITIPAGATDTKLRVDLIIGATVPADFYTFSVVTPAGTAQSGAIPFQVTPPVARFSVSPTVTVGMMSTVVPPTSAPSGSASAVSGATTVEMPVVTTVPTTSAPAGPSFEVSPATSVVMP
jgi:YD repeat-containing protein